MQIHLLLIVLEHPMLVPARLTDTELVTSFLKSRKILCFVAGIGQDKNDVDDRLGCKTRNGGGPDVFDAQGALAESRGDPLRLLLESMRPLRVVVNQKNGS